MAITSGIVSVASTVYGYVNANQQRQKAKGVAGQAAAAQAAADTKLQQAHDANIQQQAQAGAVARNAAAAPAPRASTLISPDLFGAQPRVSPTGGAAGTASQMPAPLAPLQRKTRLGQ